MGKLEAGFLGPMTGKLSNAVGFKRGNINVIRVNSKKTKPASEAQALQQERFKETVRLLRRFLTVFRVGFKSGNASKSPMNLAVKANSEALIGDYPDLMWDFSQLKLSEGTQTDLSGDVTMESTQVGEISLTWKDNSSDDIDALAGDQVLFVFFSEEKQQVIVKKNAAVRGALGATVTLPQALSGTTIHAWAIVTGITTKNVSFSNYSGSVILA